MWIMTILHHLKFLRYMQETDSGSIPFASIRITIELPSTHINIWITDRIWESCTFCLSTNFRFFKIRKCIKPTLRQLMPIFFNLETKICQQYRIFVLFTQTNDYTVWKVTILWSTSKYYIIPTYYIHGIVLWT